MYSDRSIFNHARHIVTNIGNNIPFEEYDVLSESEKIIELESRTTIVWYKTLIPTTNKILVDGEKLEVWIIQNSTGRERVFEVLTSGQQLDTFCYKPGDWCKELMEVAKNIQVSEE